jgi:hypothetical protein
LFPLNLLNQQLANEGWRQNIQSKDFVCKIFGLNNLGRKALFTGNLAIARMGAKR